MTTQSSSQVKSGEFSWATKHFWSFTAKQHCSILLNGSGSETEMYDGSRQIVQCDPSLWKIPQNYVT